MKAPHPIVQAVHDIRDTLYRLGREWESTVEEVKDPDASEALTIALSDGYPLGRDIDDLVAELDTYAEHVERVLDARPTVLQLVADEIGQDIKRVTADLTDREPGKSIDDEYRAWQNGGLGGEIGRFGGVFTPSVAASLAQLLLAVEDGEQELIQQRADRFGRDLRAARRQSHT